MGKRALFSTLLCAASVFWLAPASIAGEAGYRYDSLGRLHQVADDTGNVATYDYDAVGNILSVTRTTNNDPPTVQITSPAGGETFMEGAPILVTVDANDDVGVVSVDLTVDGHVRGHGHRDG